MGFALLADPRTLGMLAMIITDAGVVMAAAFVTIVTTIGKPPLRSHSGANGSL